MVNDSNIETDLRNVDSVMCQLLNSLGIGEDVHNGRRISRESH
jgi:hypothetical protein